MSSILPQKAPGDTPEGVADLGGNSVDWTSSLWGEVAGEESEVGYRYPYDATDGPEDREAPPSIERVARGGSWNFDPSFARAVVRDYSRPYRTILGGAFRLACPPA